ncbi:MAG: ribonuclease domain-containing protein [Gallionella sp.]|jgi:ribonuclease T1|nr:ribonuclease domain-containing protein [Gallionella sp.]
MVRALRLGLLAAVLWMPLPAVANPPVRDEAGVVAVGELPAEARETLQLIKRGGPFPYPRDGAIFRNHERKLPRQSRGYYHEYTVKTPGLRHRGARRIVCGPLPECYYSADHYNSFKQIQESQ